MHPASIPRATPARAGQYANNEKLLQALSGVDEAQRGARFQCLLVYLRHADDPTPIICQGTWEGRILTAIQGDAGFGYDPLFFVPEEDCSAAELAPNARTRSATVARPCAACLPR